MKQLNELIGETGADITIIQMTARAVIVFFISLLYLRIAGLRTFGKKSSFDQVTVLMTGALLAKAIMTDDPFFGVLIAALVLMLLHRMLAWFCMKDKKIGRFFKGAPIPLIQNGEFLSHNMRKTHITEQDIRESLRRDMNTGDLTKVKEAYLEPSGEISLVKHNP